jgi:CheY-like chemotaxis protein
VRLGIEAPEEVGIFREEVWLRGSSSEGQKNASTDLSPDSRVAKLSRLICNRLTVTEVGLAVLRKQLQDGLLQDGEETVDEIEDDLQLLRARLERESLNTPAQTAAKHLKALLVEDDHNERELLAGFLRQAGLEVATAGDGVDAVDHLRKARRPDFVLLDMLMPRCDGPATLQAIRGEPAWAGLKIFALSGHSPDYFGIDPDAAGIHRWFRKPVDPEELLRELSDELGGLA